MKRVARTLFALLIVIVAVIVLTMPYLQTPNMDTPEFLNRWPGAAIVLVTNTVIFAPFFLATHVINEARRTKRVYKPFDVYLTFISLYFGMFGGFLYAHRLVREVFSDSHSDHAAGANEG